MERYSFDSIPPGYYDPATQLEREIKVHIEGGPSTDCEDDPDEASVEEGLDDEDED